MKNASKKTQTLKKMMQSNVIDFKGQNIFVGIDVHKKNWQVSVMSDMPIKKDDFHMPSNNVVGLLNHLQTHYPGATYYSAYESGFSGFSTHRKLTDAGIHNIVVNASDVPTTQKEKVTKTDAVDARKLAEALKNGSVKGIYVPTEEEDGLKNLQRKRDDYAQELGGKKSQIKHFLLRNGIEYETEFAQQSNWSTEFVKWLRDIDLPQSLRLTLDGMLDDYDYLKRQKEKFTGYLRTYLRENRMDDLERIASVPGVGLITAMVFLTEIGDFSRFNNQRAFASYIGLAPTSHDSGDKKVSGEITFRSNRRLRSCLIESSWVAIREDDRLKADFLAYTRRMNSCNAIVRIAKKLANRILHVMKEKEQYVIKRGADGERIKNTFYITRKKNDCQTSTEGLSNETNCRGIICGGKQNEGAAMRLPLKI